MLNVQESIPRCEERECEWRQAYTVNTLLCKNKQGSAGFIISVHNALRTRPYKGKTKAGQHFL